MHQSMECSPRGEDAEVRPPHRLADRAQAPQEFHGILAATGASYIQPMYHTKVECLKGRKNDFCHKEPYKEAYRKLKRFVRTYKDT